MSHFPNDLKKSSKYTVAPSATVTARKAVEMTPTGVAGVDLTRDILSVLTTDGLALDTIRCIVPLTETKVLIVFPTNAKVCNLEDGVATLGDSLTFAYPISWAVGVALTEAKIALSYIDSNSTGDNGTTSILSISVADVISISSSIVTKYVRNILKISSTKIVMAHGLGTPTDFGGFMFAIGNIGVDDVLTITESPQEFQGTEHEEVFTLCGLTTTSFICFIKYVRSEEVYALKFDISNADIVTRSAILMIETGWSGNDIIQSYKRSSFLSAAQLSDTLIVVATTWASRNYITGQRGAGTPIKLLIISGSAMSLSTTIDLYGEVSLSDVQLIATNNLKFVVQRTSISPVTLSLFKVSGVGNSINNTASIDIVETSAMTSRIILRLSSTKVLEATKLSTGETTIKVVSLAPGEPKNILGFADFSAIQGQTVYVSAGSEIDGFADLIPGTTYYLANDGGLSTTPMTVLTKIAVALSATKIRWLEPIL
jgi:hypothetical protein